MNSTSRNSGRQESKLLLLEPFYGGSHRDVADSIVAYSSHDVDLRTLPARFWKWRMRGAALHFAKELEFRSDHEVILCSGLMDVAALKALIRPPCPPVVLYCHETQLSYPSPRQTEADLHFAFTDLVNMTCAETVLFNSRSHRDRYFAALPAFLRKLPEFRPMWAVDALKAKSRICYPGIRAPSPAPQEGDGDREAPRSGAPLIVWNHRWEFDKAPGEFFAALRRVRDSGIGFRLALLGENFATVPPEFPQAREEFAGQIDHYGYLPRRAEYEQWLRRADVVVSTAIQENFGISVMEAVANGCFPVLPRRLSYPEIIPERFHENCLYSDFDSLVELLSDALTKRRTADPLLVQHARSFAWERRIAEFDGILKETSEHARG